MDCLDVLPRLQVLQLNRDCTLKDLKELTSLKELQRLSVLVTEWQFADVWPSLNKAWPNLVEIDFVAWNVTCQFMERSTGMPFTNPAPISVLGHMVSLRLVFSASFFFAGNVRGRPSVLVAHALGRFLYRYVFSSLVRTPVCRVQTEWMKRTTPVCLVCR